MKNNNNKFFLIVITILLLIIIGLLLFIISNNYNIINTNKDDNYEVEKEIPEEELTQVIEPKEIKELDISIEYPNNQEVEIEYELKRNGDIEANYKNTFTNDILVNDDAIQFIENNILTINYKNPQSEIVDSVLNNLSLDESFYEFELDIEFADGENLEFSIGD